MLYGTYQPYGLKSDDTLSSLCQLQIFLAITSAIVQKSYPDSGGMTAVLMAMLALATLAAFFFEEGVQEYALIAFRRAARAVCGCVAMPLRRRRARCEPMTRPTGWTKARDDNGVGVLGPGAEMS